VSCLLTVTLHIVDVHLTCLINNTYLLTYLLTYLKDPDPMICGTVVL